MVTPVKSLAVHYRELDQLPPCPYPMLKIKWEETFVGSHLKPWKSLEEDKNPHAEGFVIVYIAWEGSASIMVPACWDLCKVSVQYYREEHVVLISGNRNEPTTEVAAVMGRWGKASKRM